MVEMPLPFCLSSLMTDFELSGMSSCLILIGELVLDEVFVETPNNVNVSLSANKHCE